MKQKIKSFFLGLKNFWYFRKEIYEFRWYDYQFNLDLFRKSLEYTADETELKGNTCGKDKMISRMRLVVDLIYNIRSDEFIEQAERENKYVLDSEWYLEKVPGTNYSRMIDGPNHDPEKAKLVIERANQLEQKNWEEIFDILKSDMQSWWD